MEEKLTGRFYHTRTLLGMVLMVEVELIKPRRYYPTNDTKVLKYRRATELDAAELKLTVSNGHFKF